jgi:hypothetical protein
MYMCMYMYMSCACTCVWLACAAVRRLGVHPDGNVTCETREHWEGDLFLIGSGRSEYVCVVTFNTVIVS